mmetsp:Transcript_19538/g.31243  ORF Transcript_19538/g.31243 Transcript_19538/m.31243 type:complete len:504 (-) Transcript_19538:162-1673(-)
MAFAASSAATRRHRRVIHRPSSSAADDLEEVATQVAHASLDSETGEESPFGSHQVALAASLKQAVSSDAGFRSTPIGASDMKVDGALQTLPPSSLFHLPTPGRNSRNPPPPPPAEPPTPPAAMAGAMNGFFGSVLPPPPAGPPASPPTKPPSAPPVMPPGACAAPSAPAPSSSAFSPGCAPISPKGPEPWGLSDAAASQAPQSKGGYREWLQARGQQAMTRSLHTPNGPSGSPVGSPLAHSPLPPASPLATTIASSVAGGPLACYPGTSTAAPCVGVVPPMPNMRMGQPPVPLAPLQPPQASSQWGMPSPCGDMMQQWYPQVQTAEMHPAMMGSQVPPMIPGLCRANSGMMGDCGQQSPSSADAYQQMMGQAMMCDLSGHQSSASQVAMMSGQQSQYGASQQSQVMSPFGHSQVQMMPGDCGAGQHMQQFSMGGWVEDPQQQMQLPQMQQPIAAPSGICQEFDRRLSHQEMMATVMPWTASGMSSEQLAEQLRAAAQNAVWED